jgi:hypothetical protein
MACHDLNGIHDRMVISLKADAFAIVILIRIASLQDELNLDFFEKLS